MRARMTWTTSVLMTERRPPVVEYRAVKPTMTRIENRLLAERSNTSGDVVSAVSGLPMASNREVKGESTDPGSLSCQGKNGSVMRVAAKGTIAITTQLMTVPK